MNSVQPAAPAAQQSVSIPDPKSFFSSNLTKNSEILSNCKNTKAYLTLYYLLTQFNSHNSSKAKDDSNQKTAGDSKNSSNLDQKDMLNLSHSQDKINFANSLLLQITNNAQNSQNNKIKKTKPKSAKKDKKAKEAKSPKKHNDVNRPKFLRSKSQPTSNFYSRSEYLFYQQKKICIPDWKYVDSKNNSIDTVNINNETSSDQFDIKMHQKLEIYENRIANGQTKYHHPAYSVQLEDDEKSKDLVPTEIESQKLANYEEIIPQQKIPLFWEPRSWDTEESHMTEDDNTKLQLRIEQEESDESFFNLIRSSSKYKYSKKYYSYSYSSSSSSQSSSSSLSPVDSPYSSSYSLGNVWKKKKESNQLNKDRDKRRFNGASDSVRSRKATEIEISNLYYETDESCDETDIELF